MDKANRIAFWKVVREKQVSEKSFACCVSSGFWEERNFQVFSVGGNLVALKVKVY